MRGAMETVNSGLFRMEGVILPDVMESLHKSRPFLTRILPQCLCRRPVRLTGAVLKLIAQNYYNYKYNQFV